MNHPKVMVIGLGRVGLPLSLWFCKKGLIVYGYDINHHVLHLLNQKKLPFFEEGLQNLLNQWHYVRFFPMDHLNEVFKVDTIVITVGTPVDEHLTPNFSSFKQALKPLISKLRKEHLIILRSTLTPTSTEKISAWIEKETRLKVGKDIYIAYCPERISEGKSLVELDEIPQIVGGVDGPSTERAKNFFQSLKLEVLESDSRSAELSKLFCNMYRYIQFGVANQFMYLSEHFERDIFEIRHLTNHRYPRCQIMKPGFAAGPCLYKDGFFLNQDIPYSDLILTSWKINESLPNFVIKKIKNEMPLSGKKVALLGLAFKKNSDDKRNSLSYKLKKLLEFEGAVVHVQDPLIKNEPIHSVCKDADVIVFAVDHDEYQKMPIAEWKLHFKAGALVFDLWNLFQNGFSFYNEKIERIAA